MKTDTPKDGDFASTLEGKRKHPSTITPAAGAEPSTDFHVPVTGARQTIQQVLVEGEEPTEEFLEEWNALESAPELSDEELAQLALNAPGEDGDTHTPE